MQRRDPSKAVQVLDLVLEFFGNGHRWRRYRLRDSEGNSPHSPDDVAILSALDTILI